MLRQSVHDVPFDADNTDVRKKRAHPPELGWLVARHAPEGSVRLEVDLIDA